MLQYNWKNGQVLKYFRVRNLGQPTYSKIIYCTRDTQNIISIAPFYLVSRSTVVEKVGYHLNSSYLYLPLFVFPLRKQDDIFLLSKGPPQSPQFKHV